MTGPADLHAALLTRLDALPSVTAYDGQVPSAPPADEDGRVYPYVVLWPSAGTTAEEARRLSGDAHGAIDWPVALTVAAGTPTWCLQAVALVRAAVEGWTPPGAAGPLREEPTGAAAAGAGRDEDTTPVRFFVPLAFRTYTG